MISALVGVVCSVALGLLGAAWWAAGAAAVLAFGAFLPGVPRAVALLLAPLVAVVALPVESLASAQFAMIGIIVALHTLPLWLALGGRVPWRGLVVVPVLAALFAALWLHPWGITVFQSDVAARTQVGLVAIMLWVGSMGVRRLQSR